MEDDALLDSVLRDVIIFVIQNPRAKEKTSAINRTNSQRPFPLVEEGAGFRCRVRLDIGTQKSFNAKAQRHGDARLGRILWDVW